MGGLGLLTTESFLVEEAAHFKHFANVNTLLTQHEHVGKE